MKKKFYVVGAVLVIVLALSLVLTACGKAESKDAKEFNATVSKLEKLGYNFMAAYKEGDKDWDSVADELASTLEDFNASDIKGYLNASLGDLEELDSPDGEFVAAILFSSSEKAKQAYDLEKESVEESGILVSKQVGSWLVVGTAKGVTDFES